MLLGLNDASEYELIKEMSGLTRHFKQFPDCCEFGCSWVDIVSAAVLMSRTIWFPLETIADGTYRGAVRMDANRLTYAKRLIGKKGDYFVKYGIGGRSGEQVREMYRAYLRTQLRPHDPDYRKALDQLVGIYLETKELSARHLRDVGQFEGQAVQINIG